MYVITGNSIAELKKDLKAMEKAIATGKTMGCGGNSIPEVKEALAVLGEMLGAKPPKTVVRECVCVGTCTCDTDCENVDDCNHVTEAYNSGYDDGNEEGYDAGYNDGRSEGYDEGYDDAMYDIKNKLGM